MRAAMSCAPALVLQTWRMFGARGGDRRSRTRKLAEELAHEGYQVSPQKVGQLLNASRYSLQATHKTLG